MVHPSSLSAASVLGSSHGGGSALRGQLHVEREGLWQRGTHTGRASSIAWVLQQAGHTALAFRGTGAQTTTAIQSPAPAPQSSTRGRESTFSLLPTGSCLLEGHPPLWVVSSLTTSSLAAAHWLSTLHMIKEACQCYSLSSSQPLLPPLCPKSVLPVCPANRFIRTVFLDSIHMKLYSCEYTKLFL